MNEEEKAVEQDVQIQSTDNDSTQEVDNEVEFTDGNGTSTETEVEQPKMLTEEEANQRVEQIAKEREKRAYAKAEREAKEKYKGVDEVYSVLKAGMGIDDPITLKEQLKSFYKEQGITLPEKINTLNEKEEKILGKSDADEIISLGADEINKVASEIYSKPIDKRTVREKVLFEELGKHVMYENAKKELVKSGAKPELLNDSSFKQFASKFGANTSMSEIYSMYNKLNTTPVEKPKSTGSVKNTPNANQIKEYYTPEEARAFKSQDLENPTLMKALEHSMQLWGKK